MSTFCHRNTDESPRIGDRADHYKYGNVRLVNQLQITNDIDVLWIAERDSGELSIVRESDLDNVGYYAG